MLKKIGILSFNVFIDKKTTKETPDVPEYMFKEGEYDNNPNTQWIRENCLTVNILMNASGSDFGPLFDYVARDLKNKMNDRDSYNVQFTTPVIFYSQKDNGEFKPFHYHRYS